MAVSQFPLSSYKAVVVVLLLCSEASCGPCALSMLISLPSTPVKVIQLLHPSVLGTALPTLRIVLQDLRLWQYAFTFCSFFHSCQ